MRFPGQWFQMETGLHQNWMRDDDPTTGRYIQPDPLGLIDGPSVYNYVGQSPLKYIDPRGEDFYNGLSFSVEVYDLTNRVSGSVDPNSWASSDRDWDFAWIECKCYKIGVYLYTEQLTDETFIYFSFPGRLYHLWRDGYWSVEYPARYCGK